MILLQNVDCHRPEPSGLKDILIAGGKIEKITEPGQLAGLGDHAEVIPCDGLLAFPGLIDQHVHIIGGGGEGGPQSSIGELAFEDIVHAGVTTVVGVLGMDGCTKSLHRLHAKARALEEQGLTVYLYTGSYAVPAPTLTNSLIDDIVLVDKVLGVGEVAISDHRSNYAQLSELVRLAADTHIGGLLGGKAGVVHLHVGDGKGGLDPLLALLDRTDLPVGMFVPTHMNRNPALFRQAARYCKSGGSIDLTAGETAGVAVPEAVARLLAAKVDFGRVTVSSDANGSLPGGGATRIRALLDDIRACILEGGVEPGEVFRLVTENVAKTLRLYPAKGVLRESSDADILIVDGEFRPVKVFCRGKLVIG